MLKTSHISASGTLAERLHEPEHRRDRQRRVDLEADVGVQAQQVQHARRR